MDKPVSKYTAVRLKAFNSSLSLNAWSVVANEVHHIGGVTKTDFFLA